MFVVAKDLVGIPGLPATTKGVQEALFRLFSVHPDFVRKREGTKAYEYHVDCLPESAREAVQARMPRQLLAQSASLLARATTKGELVTGAGGEKGTARAGAVPQMSDPAG